MNNRLKTCLKLIALPLAIYGLMAFGSGPANAENIKTFIALLNSGQETQDPPVSSNALGVAHMTFDETSGMLCYSISYTELLGVETAAHFHGPAAPGENAGILFGISPPPDFPSDLGSPKKGCVGPVQEAERAYLKNGLLYINVHSTQYPAGEIRGQVVPIKGTR